MRTADRNDAIDAYRGLAALAVCLQHVATTRANGNWGTNAPNPLNLHLGQAAVSVFFVISGYCLAAAAERVRREQRSFGWFMWRRARRIWPPYLFSIAFWAGTRLLKIRLTGSGREELFAPASTWISNLTMTQWLGDARPFVHGEAHWFVATHWSLAFEEQFYLVIGLLAVSSLGVLRPTLWLLAASIVWYVLGLQGSIFLSRWALFALGVIAYHRKPPALATTFALCAASVLCGIWLLRAPWTPTEDPLVCLAACLFTLLLTVGRPAGDALMNSPLGRPLRALGTISFSLYLVHYPVLSLVGAVAAHLVPSAAPRVVFWAVQAVIHLLIAIPFWWLCERPFLNSQPRSAAIEAVPAAASR